MVEIDLPGFGARAARVMWAGGRHAGCAFTEPLTIEVVTQVVRAAPVVWGRFAAPPPDGPAFKDMRRSADLTAAIDPPADPDDLPTLRPRVRLAAILGLSALLWSALALGAWLALG